MTHALHVLGSGVSSASERLAGSGRSEGRRHYLYHPRREGLGMGHCLRSEGYQLVPALSLEEREGPAASESGPARGARVLRRFQSLGRVGRAFEAEASPTGTASLAFVSPPLSWLLCTCTMM